MSTETRIAVHPTDAPRVIGPFSHGVVASGRLLFVSGQGPQDPSSGGFRLGNFEEEVRLTLDNVGRVLRAAGTDWSSVVRVGVYLARKEDFAAFNALYAQYVQAPFPARSTIICQLLAGISVEVDCVAALP